MNLFVGILMLAVSSGVTFGLWKDFLDTIQWNNNHSISNYEYVVEKLKGVMLVLAPVVAVFTLLNLF